MGIREIHIRHIIACLLLASLFFPLISQASLLNERTYKRLERVHKLMDQKNYTEAFTKLKKLQDSVNNRSYEQALVLQTFGYLYSATNETEKAIQSFQQCLDIDATPAQVAQNIKLNIAQLYLELNKNREALSMYQQWLENEKKPSPAALVLGGMLYADIKDYQNAEQLVNKAIKLSSDPRESWYQLLLAIYYETKKYTESAALLEKMLVNYPDNKNYWLQLSGIYFSLNKDSQALTVSQLAYAKGLLTTEKEILNLAKLYLYLDLPLQAAKILEDNLALKRLTENETNLLLLANSFLQARETRPAITYLEKVAEQSNNPDHSIRLANLHAAMENWPQVSAILQQADLKTAQNPGQAYILKGIAFYEQNKKQDAISSFKQASIDTKTQHNAQQWLKLINSEQ